MAKGDAAAAGETLAAALALWHGPALAHFRCQAFAALAQYQAARRMLADELGLEPSPGPRELERMILAHDPALALPRLEAGLRTAALLLTA
jgi:hypothetical protein